MFPTILRPVLLARATAPRARAAAPRLQVHGGRRHRVCFPRRLGEEQVVARLLELLRPRLPHLPRRRRAGAPEQVLRGGGRAQAPLGPGAAALARRGPARRWRGRRGVAGEGDRALRVVRAAGAALPAAVAAGPGVPRQEGGEDLALAPPLRRPLPAPQHRGVGRGGAAGGRLLLLLLLLLLLVVGAGGEQGVPPVVVPLGRPGRGRAADSSGTLSCF